MGAGFDIGFLVRRKVPLAADHGLNPASTLKDPC
jgi:hypothetical protein